MKKFQEIIKKSFKVESRIFGLNENTFITKDNKTNEYLVDYNIMINEDKLDLMNYPHYIHNIFLYNLNRIDPDIIFTYKMVKSEINAKIKYNDTYINLYLSIFSNAKVHKLSKICYNRYISMFMWIRILDLKDFDKKMQRVKEDGYYEELKKLYITTEEEYKKDPINEEKTLFEILLDSLRLLWDKHYLDLEV